MFGQLDLGSEEGEDQLMKMMQGMMSTLLSKEVLYPSLKELCKQVSQVTCDPSSIQLLLIPRPLPSVTVTIKCTTGHISDLGREGGANLVDIYSHLLWNLS